MDAFREEQIHVLKSKKAQIIPFDKKNNVWHKIAGKLILSPKYTEDWKYSSTDSNSKTVFEHTTVAEIYIFFTN